MSDIGEYTIILFDNNIYELKEILEISLNVIFFHRNLSNNIYEDVQSKIADITYVKLKNETLSKEIIDLINEMENNFTNESNLYGYNLTLSFFEKYENSKISEIPWEKWNFITVLNKKGELEEKNGIKADKSNSNINKGNKVRDYIFKIIDKLNDKKNCMPCVNLKDKNLINETFEHSFKTEKIKNKEQYFSLFNYYMKNNQEDIIVINF